MSRSTRVGREERRMMIYDDREQQDGRTVRASEHRDKLMPPPRNFDRKASSDELLRVIEEGKVELSLPTKEAVTDWIHRRWANVDQVVTVLQASSSSHVVASPDMGTDVSRGVRNATRCLPPSRPLEIKNDIHDEQDNAASPSDCNSTMLYRQVSQDVDPPDDYANKMHQHSAHHRRGRMKENNRFGKGNLRPDAAYKREQLEVDLSHQHALTLEIPVDHSDVEGDRKRHQEPGLVHHASYHQHHLEHRNERLGSISNINRQGPHLHKEGDFTSISDNSDATQDEVIQFGREQPYAECDDDSSDVLNRSASVSSLPSQCLKRKKSGIDGNDVPKTLPTVTTTFKNIIGHQAVKLRMEEVLLPLALPTSMCKSILQGIRAYSPSMLLYGPPGCGKVHVECHPSPNPRCSFSIVLLTSFSSILYCSLFAHITSLVIADATRQSAGWRGTSRLSANRSQ
jgi:hypothetical protein